MEWKDGEGWIVSPFDDVEIVMEPAVSNCRWQNLWPSFPFHFPANCEALMTACRYRIRKCAVSRCMPRSLVCQHRRQNLEGKAHFAVKIAQMWSFSEIFGGSMTSQTFDSTLSFQLEVISRTSSGVPHFYEALTV